MKNPYIPFGWVGVVSAVISVLIFLTKSIRYSSAVKAKGIVASGYWITNNKGLPSEQRIWVATVSYEDQNGTRRSFNPTFGLSPAQQGKEVEILLFPDGSAMLNGFREKWIWAILFAIPGVLFGWMLFAAN